MGDHKQMLERAWARSAPSAAATAAARVAVLGAGAGRPSTVGPSGWLRGSRRRGGMAAVLLVSMLVAAGAVFAITRPHHTVDDLKIGVFERPQVAQDRLPANALRGPQGRFLPDSTRLVGKDGTRQIYAAEQANGDVCVIVWAPAPAGQSSGCTDADTVAAGAGWLRSDTQAPDGSYRMALYAIVPDGFSTARLGDRSLAIQDNIAVFGAGPEAESLTLVGPAGTATIRVGSPPQSRLSG